MGVFALSPESDPLVQTSDPRRFSTGQVESARLLRDPVFMRRLEQLRTIPLRSVRGPISGDFRVLSALEADSPRDLRWLIEEKLETARHHQAYTIEHSMGVAVIALKIGQGLGLPPAKLGILFIGGLMHDVGKLAVDPTIINKTDRLTAAEYTSLKRHTESAVIEQVFGKELKANPDLRLFLKISLQHHERFDGRGYPNGLYGEQIDPCARIISIADTLHAMVSDRSYRKGKPWEVALQKLESERDDGQFDPLVLDLALKVLRAELQTESAE
jgi:HD-GYP domain-containing protein (c-di-GMP phosphodiesterase class II)